MIIALVAAAGVSGVAFDNASLTARAVVPQPAPPVTIQVLGINDFHGRLVAGAGGALEAGAAVLAGAVTELETAYPNTVFAAAGDLIGASTFESFIAHDKPTIDALNDAGLDVSAVGNHELDQGYNDLVNRVMAPYNAMTNPYGGANWQYLAANVRNTAGMTPALPETWYVDFGTTRVGFIGAVTDALKELVSPAGIAGLTIEAPVTAANRSAADLKAAGADIIILLVHEGAPSTSYADAVTNPNVFSNLVNNVSDDIDAIISGHTHLSYNHAVPVPGWAGRPVTTRPVVSAGQYGYNLNQLLFQVDSNDDVVGLTQTILPLVKVPAYTPDASTATIVSNAVTNANVLGAAVLGQIGGGFKRAVRVGPVENRGSESTLGNLVAEAQRWATGASIAFMNPGGLRADMVGNGPPYAADLTYRQAANVQPFANTLVTMDLTGTQIRAALEQQWQPVGASRPYLQLGTSKGFSYTYDPNAAAGSRILDIRINGELIDNDDVVRVAVNSFLAAGGDNFGTFAAGTNRKDSGQVDLQAMVDYMDAFGSSSAVPVDFRQHGVGIDFPVGAPATYKPGEHVVFNVSSWAMTGSGDLQDATIGVGLQGTPVGIAVGGPEAVVIATPIVVDNALETPHSTEAGKATVDIVLPDALVAGPLTIVLNGNTTGTVARTTITIEEIELPPTGTNLDAVGFAVGFVLLGLVLVLAADRRRKITVA